MLHGLRLLHQIPPAGGGPRLRGPAAEVLDALSVVQEDGAVGAADARLDKGDRVGQGLQDLRRLGRALLLEGEQLGGGVEMAD